MLTQLQTYTPEQYPEQEEQADYKREYRQREIIPRTGGTTNHNQLAFNLAMTLRSNLKRQSYKVYIGDVHPWIPRYEQFTYPEVMVIHGAPQCYGNSTTTVTNPCFMTDVLSPSTQIVLDEAGVIRSRQFPGLWLAVNRPLAGDLAAVLATLQQGIAIPEHQAFLKQLHSASFEV
ncbi:MAG: Uma2 family endonuclease [Cyanobacteria bacterium]|nr:Uma2 family endonuclease [Cyanobacteriota bacterium]